MRDQVPHDLTSFGLAAGAAGPGHHAASGLGILTPLAPWGVLPMTFPACVLR